ncbi:hypothetical protein [Pseudonocardia oceani]|uniref:Small secreted domain DUF320 n=1 Tax=Pseudonocardia oceani TaxID=2792013 RepID=A0ABS6UBP8_9PSEU|nr:hypothetical protein [Pseudonocardia oceani]MBW0092560.1 hypothetical protein [Pseudonocardia oceani]MBW0111802.1 hypothetical protein [Pseudonocardia oceani]MBW0129666.1 hypothetical protein [Pseudonocardia oceani]
MAASAAALLALSPLAFAGDEGDHGHGHDGDRAVNSVEDDSETTGLVNVADNEANVPVQACNNDIPVNVLGVQVSDVQADLTGALGVLGEAEAEDEGGAGDVRACEQENSSGGSIVQGIDD